MIYLTLDKNAKTNYIYQQIYEGIKEYILLGRLKPGEKLPPKRTLARQLKVSMNSVMTAYDQLLTEGYIYTTERKGYFVEKITQFINQGDAIESSLPSDLKESIVDKEEWLSLSHMTSNISLFPFKKWFRCQQKTIDHHQRELSEIIHPQGPYIVRKTICRLIALTRGVICEPEQIVIGAGTMSLIRQLMDMRDRNTVIAMEDPGYSRLYHLLKSMEFDVHPVKIDEKGISIKEIEAAKANFVFVTPSHQFPTGKIMPISRRIELLNWSTYTEDRYIVEDDYDSEFKYETDNIPSLQSLDRNQRVIYTGTFSKTMLPGIRISYMVLPPGLLREYRRHYQHLIQSSNTINLFTLHYFIKNGEYHRHVKRMNHHYETKRKILINELIGRFKDNIQIEDIPAGLHFYAHFRSNKDYEEIEERAKQEKLEIYTMKRFMLNNIYKHQNIIELVIGFASIPEDKIAEAVDRLYRAMS
ncbi:MocR-like transcriptional regulator GabR [Metabacillus arenae]|uniref:PLP-dependent aminotransferase family protein n=1 Tax=Metabacillus arenae TaxID=2771434 RepID=A0A926NRI8_9BACI|nr:PLP-dependent aminotransferase family protein [Metabacillus arenae]MBD1382662.1 PLP-dependent aminotransferase family protein [Metabacillus arenae]